MMEKVIEEEKIKTKFRIEKEARELEIYNEWNELMSLPGAMASAVDKHLREKHGFGADSTIWFIRKRVKKRLQEAANKS